MKKDIIDSRQDLEKNIIKAELWELIKESLSPLEYYIIQGLYVEEKTFEEMGFKWSKSKQEIARIAQKARVKLSNVIDKDYIKYI